MESGDTLVKAGLGLLRGAGRGLVDLAWPPTCLNCHAPVASPESLCPACFVRLRPITAPMCPRLGLPFEIDLGPGALSAEALAEPPPFRRARSAVIYDEIARALVSRLKYGDRPELAGFCARLMAGAGREFWGDTPVLVPVPLHPFRQFRRRYNQSTELGRALSGLLGLALDPTLVTRQRPTRRQVGLSATQRQRNVAGAFRVHPRIAARLAGRPIVLIDDVITTGATIRAITHALNRAGIEAVDVLSFARVVVGAETTI